MDESGLCRVCNHKIFLTDISSESVISPKKAFQSFNRSKHLKKAGSSNTSCSLTDSYENRRKISIKQSMGDRPWIRQRINKLDLSWMPLVNQCQSVSQQQQMKDLIQSLSKLQ